MEVSLDTTSAIAALREYVRFRDDDPVTAFLAERPRLVPLLREAAERVGDFCPTGTTLALEFFEEPADPYGPAKLYATIENDLPMPEAREQLYRFRDAWWREASGDFVGQVSLVIV